MRAFRTREVDRIRAGLDRLPWSGPLFLFAIFALSAMPPFGLFHSEFQIVEGGLGADRFAPAAVLVVLVTLAFLGVSRVRQTFVLGAQTRETPGRWLCSSS